MDFLKDLPGTPVSLVASEDYEPTSAVQYVNAQLISHGLVHSPGLSLDGLANEDSKRLVKCLLGMLGQRIEDLRRVEELSTKLRTLTYEHERLQSMHGAAVDASANAEREMNLFKSKMAASQKSLATETAAHKQTMAELQRTRTSLQYLRSTSQNELKRKDKDVERVMERWNKVADAQAKILATPSGLRCANLAAGIAEPVRGIGLMEQALEQAEEARGELVKENDAFRSVLLGAANALQGTIHTVRGLSAGTHVEEPSPLSHPALFAPPTSPLSQPENAHTKLRQLFATFRDAISNISAPAPAPVNVIPPATEDEIKKLNELVTSLRAELAKSRESSAAIATQSQAVLDRFTVHASERLVSGRDPTPEEAAELSLELICVPERDEIREKLEARAAKLKEEREKFTEAALKLGKERAAVEAERMKMLEEKRRWAVDQMLAELPPTPGPDPDLVSPPRPVKMKLKQNPPSPPRVRQRKASAAKGPLGSPSKKAAASKRSTEILGNGQSEDGGAVKKLKEKKHSTLEVLYEPERGPGDPLLESKTGLQRSTTPDDSPPITAPGALAPEMKKSLPLVLPTTFTLPPHSPASSFTALDIGPLPSQPQRDSGSPIRNFDAIPLASTSVPVAPAGLPRPRAFPSPRTPRPILNPHLKHAYSPVRPSPLSRILMLADSPPSPPSVPPIPEEPEEDQPRYPDQPRPNALPKRLLARERGIPIDEPSPLRERTGGNLNGKQAEAQQKGGEKRFTAKEKGKARAVQDSEKENVAPRAEDKPKASGAASTSVKTKAAGPESRKASAVRVDSKSVVARSGAVSKGASGSGAGPSTAGNRATSEAPRPGGARRVPIDSVNARKLGVRRI